MPRARHHAPVLLADDAQVALQEQWAGAVADDEIPALLAGLSADDVQSIFAQTLLRRWAAQHPDTAAAWAAGLAAGATRIHSLSTVVIAWTPVDLPAAIEWLRCLPADDDRPRLAATVAQEAVALDPRTALALLPLLAPGEALRLHASAAAAWAASDPVAAYLWAAALPPSPGRDAAMAAMAAVWADDDPPGALLLLRQEMRPGRERDLALAIVAAQSSCGDSTVPAP